jgi:hypothetical protein
MKTKIVDLLLRPSLALSLLFSTCAFAQTTAGKKIINFQLPEQTALMKTVSQNGTKSSLVKSQVTAQSIKAEIFDLQFDTNMKASLTGVGNGGGGADLDNKAIESYSKIPNVVKGWSLVESTLAKLDSKFPNLSEKLRKKANAATWYLVPIRLVKLPNGFQGLPFNSDQSIINMNNEVFINSLKWDRKTDADAGILLFHEIIMLYLKDHFQGERLHSATRKIGSYFLNYLDTTNFPNGFVPLLDRDFPTSAAYEDLKSVETIANEKLKYEQAVKFQDQIIAEFKTYAKQPCSLQPLPLTMNQVERMNTQELINYANQIKSVISWNRGIYLRSSKQKEVIRVCSARYSCDANEIWNTRYEDDSAIVGAKLFVGFLNVFAPSSSINSENVITGLYNNSTSIDFLFQEGLSKGTNPFEIKNENYARFILENPIDLLEKSEYRVYIRSISQENSLMPFMKNMCDWALKK